MLSTTQLLNRLTSSENTVFGEVQTSIPNKHQKQPGRWYAYLKKKGGLGVIDLKKHNEALLLKNLDKFFNKKDIP